MAVPRTHLSGRTQTFATSGCWLGGPKTPTFAPSKTLEDSDCHFNSAINRKQLFKLVGGSDLVHDFMKDEAFKQQDKTLRRYLKPDLVIIDDLAGGHNPFARNGCSSELTRRNTKRRTAKYLPANCR